jgi:ElaB/YqjD/DUF883 family membrane-anchored ribosome-binding protein
MRPAEDYEGNGMGNMSKFDDVKATASAEISNLLADVEELVARSAGMEEADVQRLRGKVQRAMDAAKQSLAESAESVRRKGQRVAESADDYIHESPWQALGIAALVGALVSVLLARRS